MHVCACVYVYMSNAVLANNVTMQVTTNTVHIQTHTHIRTHTHAHTHAKHTCTHMHTRTHHIEQHPLYSYVCILMSHLEYTCSIRILMTCTDTPLHDHHYPAYAMRQGSRDMRPTLVHDATHTCPIDECARTRCRWGTRRTCRRVWAHTWHLRRSGQSAGALLCILNTAHRVAAAARPTSLADDELTSPVLQDCVIVPDKTKRASTLASEDPDCTGRYGWICRTCRAVGSSCRNHPGGLRRPWQ
jgi:hypothetical protein